MCMILAKHVVKTSFKVCMFMQSCHQPLLFLKICFKILIISEIEEKKKTGDHCAFTEEFVLLMVVGGCSGGGGGGGWGGDFG